VNGSRLRHIRSSVTGAHAVVSDRAAALRALRIGGIDLVEPTLDSPEPPAMSGAILAPWPNRVEGATWTYRGRQFRLAVTEPELGHANHGLLTETDFEAVNPDAGDVLRLCARIAGAVGYPFTVEIEVEYRLFSDGLAVGLVARNRGDDIAPLALGAHPYLRIGHAPSESLTVRIDADAAYTLDATNIPRARFNVTGTRWDLRDGRPVVDSPAHATFER
jgi:aldose 1-epimerase